MISIRNMEESDLEAIHAISVRSFSSPWSLKAIQEEFHHPFAYYLTASQDNTLIAFIGAWLILDEVQITNIAVDPDYRRQGIANVLLRGMIKEMNAKQMAVIYLEVRLSNTAAIRLYESLAFKTTGLRKGFYPDGEDALTMALFLEDPH